MQGPLAPGHAAAVLDLLLQGPPDCVLVSPCGGRVEVASLLLAIHSPVMATLLKQGGKGISLPFPINEIMSIVRLLQGLDEEQEVQEEVAQLLGITFSEKKVFSSLHIKKKKGNTKLESDQKIKMSEAAGLFFSVTPQKMIGTKVELEMDPVFPKIDFNNHENADKYFTNLPLSDRQIGKDKSKNIAVEKHRARKMLRRKIGCEQCLSSFKTKGGLKRHKLKKP